VNYTVKKVTLTYVNHLPTPNTTDPIADVTMNSTPEIDIARPNPQNANPSNGRAKGQQGPAHPNPPVKSPQLSDLMSPGPEMKSPGVGDLMSPEIVSGRKGLYSGKTPTSAYLFSPREMEREREREKEKEVRIMSSLLFFKKAILQFTIVRGRDLVPDNTELTSYCTVSVQKTKGRCDPIISKKGRPRWNFHWATLVTSLGTKESPTTLLIEIWQNGFFSDYLMGNVSLPILDYADKKTHTFWVPIHKDQTVSGQIQIVLAFDWDMTTSLPLKKIEQMYQKILPTLPRGSETEFIENKLKLIQQYYVPEINGAEHFILLFKNRKMTSPEGYKYWDKLVTKLDPGKPFFCQWVHVKGIHWIFYSLSSILLNISIPEIDLFEYKKKRLFTVILVCLERLKCHTKVISTHNFITILFQTLPFVDIEDQMIIFSILLEQCADKERNWVVLDTRNFMFSQAVDYNLIKNELFSGCHLPFKISFLALINGTIIAAIGRGKLEQIRDVYYENGTWRRIS